MPTIRDGLETALNHHRTGQLREAESIYRQINELAPNQPDAWHLRGVIATQIGRPDVALEYIGKAIELNPFAPVFQNSLASAYDALGRHADAIAAYEKALELKGDYSEAHFNLGRLRERLGRLDEAKKSFELALRFNASYVEALHQLGRLAMRQGNVEQAAEHFRSALRIKPEFTPAIDELGMLRLEQHRYAEAMDQFLKLVKLDPRHADGYYHLGLALQGAGQLDEAEAAHKQALQLNPQLYEAQNNLGICLALRGRLQDSELCFRETIKLKPDYSDAHSNFGNVYLSMVRRAEAIACYRQALALNPNNAQAYSNISAALAPDGFLTEAAQCAQQAVNLLPNYADALNNLANIYKELGMFDESMAASRRALEVRPVFPSAHSNLLLAMNYDPRMSAERIFQEHQAWYPAQVKDVSRPASYKNTKFPDRPLRIGYVSPDFREHPVASFLEPILTHHNQKLYPTILYSDTAAPDITTQRLAQYADAWRETLGRTDAEIAAQVMADEIDVLVDLSGHTAHNRLPLFARKPAPVQVSYLGYPTTTGVPEIDYLLTDAIVDRPDDERFYVEKLVRLSPGFACFAPSPFCPAVSASPALLSGRVTFGSLNGLMKLNADVIALWARLLRETPGARLLLVRTTFRGSVRERILGEFARHGVDTSRVELRDSWPTGQMHYSAYHEIDIALDVFPWSGHTTACEALWMGLPVVTLEGNRHAGRMVASVLHSAGLSSWTARTPNEYAAIAQSLAADVPSLAEIRNNLRARLAASPLCDGAAFTRQLESVFRQMWRNWCAA